MPKISPETLQFEIEKDVFRELYFLTGEEYLREEGLSLILSRAVSLGARDLNVDIFYGDDLDPGNVVNALLSFPMMSERKLVVFRQPVSASESALSSVFSAIRKPFPYSVFVMVDEISGLRKLERKYSQIMSSFYVVEFKKLYGKGLTRWVADKFKAEDKSIDREVAQLLVTLAGENLSDIMNEITNTVLFVGDKRQVEKGDVEEAIGASRADNVFELSKAIGEREFDRARIMVRKMMDQGEKPPRVIYFISDYFLNLMKVSSLKGKGLSKKAMLKDAGVPVWLLERYISHSENFNREEIARNLKALMDADDKLKSSGYDPATVMELLIYKICSSNG